MEIQRADCERCEIMNCLSRASALLACGLALVILTCGCGVDFAYLLPAAAGQVELLANSVPIEDAISAGTLTDEQIEKLKLIEDVRDYASGVIGLVVNDNYTTFYDSRGEDVAYNISACRKDSFTPRTWTFPFVGTVPYLGYFDYSQAVAKRDSLQAEGLDTMMYPIDAYSGIGYFVNPILSPMLERAELDLIDTVIHELLHNTIWRANDTSYSESLATFVGRRGTLSYIADRMADDPDKLAEATQKAEDTDRYNDFALDLYNELDAFYRSSLSSEEKVSGRDTLYQAGRDRFTSEIKPLMNIPSNYEWVKKLPANNAWMMSVRRYNLDLDVFERVFEANNGDWEASLTVFDAASRANDAFAYLDSWSASQNKVTSVQTSNSTPSGNPTETVSDTSSVDDLRICPRRHATTYVATEARPSR